MADPLPIQSLNHIGLTTLRLDESRHFYRDVLGFREVSRPDLKFPGAWLFNYGVMIHLMQSDQAGSPGGEINTRANHLALHSDDMETAEERLQQHNVPYRKNEIKERNIRQLFFHDPDGNHVEIGIYPPTPPFI